ncbi:flippase-like domain-containing protein [Alteromonas pelagimontana]|uniref:Flippase-like domain-containing protein n=1 Tax=Alteromonas pelagimontana TaxID=1858656 RepID=A0A6M4MAY9_9ALTE|nr:lysylphosphatidylglycerol synthase transmembrane domain-containing protein [Alteromonas pelagimontana]QJR80159.1 flippase-like domain-containing protein [Alteromonas pelagimontana]
MHTKRSLSSASTQFQFSRVKLFLFVLLFISLSALVPWTIQRELEGQFSQLWDKLATASFILPALALLFIYYLSDALRLWFALRAVGRKQAFLSMIPMIFINLLFSNVTPMATGGGVAQVWFLHKQGVQVGAAVAATTLRTLMASMMIFIPAPLVLFSIKGLSDSSLSSRWGTSLAIFALLYALFFIILLWRPRWLASAVDKGLALICMTGMLSQSRRHRWRLRFLRELVRFTHYFRIFFKGKPVNSLFAVISTMVFLLSLFSFPALILWTLGYSFNYFTVLMYMLVNTFVMYFAPTPGAAGVAEGVFALLFATVVDSVDLFVLVVGWRFLTVHLGMLIGVPVSLYAIFHQEQKLG